MKITCLLSEETASIIRQKHFGLLGNDKSKDEEIYLMNAKEIAYIIIEWHYGSAGVLDQILHEISEPLGTNTNELLDLIFKTKTNERFKNRITGKV